MRFYQTWQENSIWDFKELDYDRTDENGRYSLKAKVVECKIIRLQVIKEYYRAINYPMDVNGPEIECPESVQTINFQLEPLRWD